MRKRFKTSRLCSSDNYEISRKIHKQDVINSHNNNKSIIATMVAKRTDKIPYVRIFGELMKISPEEAIGSPSEGVYVSPTLFSLKIASISHKP